MTEQEEQQQEPQDKLAGERLQKALAQAGIGSRREMEEWITAGRITVNGNVATLGMRVVEDDVVRVDQRIVHLKAPNESLFIISLFAFFP